MKVDSPIVQDNSLVYSRLLQDLRQHAEIRRMFIWRNGMQQLHFCSQWNEDLGVVPDRLERIRQVAMKKRMVVTSIEQTGLQQSSPDQQAVAIYRGFADASVLELHLLLSEDPVKMKAQVTKLEQTMQPIADDPAPQVPQAALVTGKNGVALSDLAKQQLAAMKKAATEVTDGSTSLARISRKDFDQQQGLVDFFTHINASLDRKEAAFNVVSELRRQTDSDRVSLIAFAQQSRGKLIATSGVAKVNRKGRETIQLEKLVNEICQQNQVFAYPSKEFVDIPSRFRSRIEKYLTNSSARSLMVIPVTLERPDEAAFEELSPAQRKKRVVEGSRTIAAIVIENFQSSELKPEVQRYHETLAHRAGDAYRNAFKHQRAFLFPLWEFLGRQYDFFIGRHFSRTMTALGVAALILICSLVFQGQFRLSCDGRLMPAEHRTIWSEIDGIVSDVHVQTAQHVQPGVKLVSLENKELKVRQQEYSGNLFSLRQRLESVDRLLAAEASEVGDSDSNARQMSIERTSLVQQIKTTEEQLRILDQQLAGQEVASPIEGTVLTADLRKELGDRPVTQGTALMEIADLEGDWVLELKMPDRKVGELLKTQQSTDQPLHVSFVRSSEPSIVYQGQVKEIDLSARIDDEVGQFLRVVVDIDASEIPAKNVGMETVAYLHCGKRSYAYIWTREIVDFVNKHIVFPLF